MTPPILFKGTVQCNNRIAVTADQQGLCIWGPSVHLQPGTYTIGVEIDVRTAPHVIFDCFAQTLGILNQIVFDDIDDDSSLCVLITVEIETTLDNYQFRLRGPQGNDFDFIAMHIRKVSA